MKAYSKVVMEEKVLKKAVLGVVPALILSGTLLWANAGGAGKILVPTARDKCPVCGMFVAKYPDWTAAIRFRDGKTAYFDGCKDMFTYYRNLKKNPPTKGGDGVQTVQVKDYYSLAPIDGRKASYVIGSDVYGPMGKELIPFEKLADAQGFMQDHKGKRVLRFDQVDTGVLKALQ